MIACAQSEDSQELLRTSPSAAIEDRAAAGENECGKASAKGQAAEDYVPQSPTQEEVIVGKGYRYKPSTHKNFSPRRTLSGNENAQGEVSAGRAESVEVLDLTVEDREDWGRHLIIHSSDVVQWSIGMYAPVVKEIAKGSARIAIPAWMFTCLLFLACECLVIVASDFLGQMSHLPRFLRILAISAKVGFALAAILAILQGLYHTYRRKRSDSPRVGIVIWPD